MFTHLHGHSSFSFLEAIGKPKHIIAKVKSLEMTAIAITDYNGMYGAVNFYLGAGDEGIKPIIGSELGFVLDINSVSNPKTIGNIVLLAKNDIGYHSLMELVSFANQQGIKFKPKIDTSILKEKSQGIIAIIGGEESWLGKMIVNGESEDKIIEIINMIKDILGNNNVFLEMTAQNESLINNVKKINNQILFYSKKTDTDCVVDNNYFYPGKDEKEAWEMALAIKDGYKMYDEIRRKPKGEYHIMNEDEIVNIMTGNGYEDKQINEWIENNNKIAESIDVKIQLGQYLFPNYENPEDVKELYEENKDKLVVEE
ncbi:MAG: PHP domain-containing protein [Candidatus Absconditicoccaceae bacterium]